MAERSITATDLLRMLPEVLAEVAQRGTVFLVSMGQALASDNVISSLVSATGEIVFVLGPPHVLGAVFALIDEEYGWPHPVQVSDVKAVSDLMPRHRRHPLIYRGSDCLAMSIGLREYELLTQS